MSRDGEVGLAGAHAHDQARTTSTSTTTSSPRHVHKSISSFLYWLVSFFGRHGRPGGESGGVSVVCGDGDFGLSGAHARF